ncbi:hypothetical protein [Salinarimonas soli]|uniref:hypothetical protein n=1 Tax=Salinarimonas soli TaxID=1638099 RepID=UPI001661B5D9|nr:hypothetical protein [Salinarimonas soli]
MMKGFGDLKHWWIYGLTGVLVGFLFLAFGFNVQSGSIGMMSYFLVRYAQMKRLF